MAEFFYLIIFVLLLAAFLLEGWAMVFLLSDPVADAPPVVGLALAIVLTGVLLGCTGEQVFF